MVKSFAAAGEVTSDVGVELVEADLGLGNLGKGLRPIPQSGLEQLAAGWPLRNSQ